jgi:hypothetical protein
MWSKYEEGNKLVSAQTVTAYEEAMTEFATSAKKFLDHIPLLTKARDACQRAMTISTELRGTLDRGDEVLRTLMAQVEHAVNDALNDAVTVQRGQDAPNENKPEATKVETIKASEEKADRARA